MMHQFVEHQRSTCTHASGFVFFTFYWMWTIRWLFTDVRSKLTKLKRPHHNPGSFQQDFPVLRAKQILLNCSYRCRAMFLELISLTYHVPATRLLKNDARTDSRCDAGAHPRKRQRHQQSRREVWSEQRCATLAPGRSVADVCILLARSTDATRTFQTAR